MLALPTGQADRSAKAGGPARAAVRRAHLDRLVRASEDAGLYAVSASCIAAALSADPGREAIFDTNGTASALL